MESEKEKKKRGWLWILIFIPIIVAGYFILNKDKTSTDGPELIGEDTLAMVQENPVVTDSILPDTTQINKVDSVKNESVDEETEEIIPEGPVYILVGGSFTKEENAEKYLQKAKTEGFEAFHLGKRGRFYTVGLGKFDSFNAANEAKRKYIAKNPGSGVWVRKE